jgi:hypothetical protein
LGGGSPKTRGSVCGRREVIIRDLELVWVDGSVGAAGAGGWQAELIITAWAGSVAIE